MSNRVFGTLVNRAFGPLGPEPLARLYVQESGTTTQRTIYADEALTVPLSQPVISDAYGQFREIFTAGADPVRILITNALGVVLNGYPIDGVVPFSTDVTGAAAIPFAPTDDIPETNVQAAIVAAGALASDQTSVFRRAATPWTTGGTSNAYTITPDPALPAYGTWQAFLLRVDRLNTGTSTLNVNALGSRPLRRMGRSSVPIELDAGDLQPGRHYSVVFDGAQFLITDQNAIRESNANGEAIREPSGLLICRQTNITMTFASTGRLTFDWVYPYPLEGAVWDVSITLPGGVEFYNGIAIGDLGQCAILSPISTGVTLVANRATGAPAFESGDTITGVRVTATGRWF